LSALDPPFEDLLVLTFFLCWQNSSSEVFDPFEFLPNVASTIALRRLVRGLFIFLSHHLHPFHLSGDKRWMKVPFLRHWIWSLSSLFLGREFLGCFIFDAFFFFLPFCVFGGITRNNICFLMVLVFLARVAPSDVLKKFFGTSQRS